MSATSDIWDEIDRDPRGRIWGPDLFAWAYGQLATRGTWRDLGPAECFEDDAEVVDWQIRIRAEMGYVPEAVVTEARALATVGTDNALLRLLVAIDRAYQGISLIKQVFDPRLEPLFEEWRGKGSLESSTARGKVLRRGVPARVGSSLSDYCTNLTFLGPSDARRITVVPLEGPHSLGEFMADSGNASLNVAFVPTLDGPDDVTFVTRDDRGAHYFELEHHPTKQEDLVRAIPSLVARLEGAGVNIALMPELVACPTLVRALQLELVANNLRSSRRGRVPHLRLAIVGVRPGSGQNEVQIIAGDGELLLTQRKMQGWILTDDLQQRYGWGSGVARRELLDEHENIVVLDDSGFGRFMFLICEDLVRSDPGKRIAVDATPTVVFSPVMDDSLERDRWEMKAAEFLASEPGALVLSANSWCLALRARAARAPKRRLRPGVGLICHPDDRRQTKIVRANPGPGVFVKRPIAWIRWVPVVSLASTI